MFSAELRLKPLFLLLIATAGLSVIVQTGCGPTPATSTGSSPQPSSAQAQTAMSCALPTDQKGSFMAPVPNDVFPVQVVGDIAFTNQERTAMAQAVDQWNQVGRQLIGK